jgi:HPt (histidine-containing phosphotransfer) domain-containing protein
MGETELLDMLAAETDRRCATIAAGVQALAASDRSNPKKVEALRVEAHGLKGAALVVGQERLAKLAKEIESTFAEHIGEGTLDVALSAKLVTATSALHEGAQAAAENVGEPPSVADAIALLESR